jgi:hypothetical protein
VTSLAAEKLPEVTDSLELPLLGLMSELSPIA